MTSKEYVEMVYLRKRWELLKYKYDHTVDGEYPYLAINSDEIESMPALIRMLTTIHDCYDR